MDEKRDRKRGKFMNPSKKGREEGMEKGRDG